MTAADSPLPSVTISSTLASPASEARRTQAQPYGNRAVPKDGDGEDHIAVSPAPRHWPRIFPGL
jgi:hypothetical protein